MASVVEILLRTEGGPAAATAAGGAPTADQKKDAKNGAKNGGKDPAANEAKKGFGKLGGMLKGASNFFRKNLGLNFGLSAMLKQSQVFTSFIGTIFQLVGALVDVILAPLLPLFFPVIRLIGSWIPKVQAFMEVAAEKIIGWMNNVIGWYDKAQGWWDEKYAEIKAAWEEGPSKLAKLIWDWVWTGLQWIWDKLLNKALPWIWDQIKSLGSSIWSWLQGWGGRVVGWLVTAYVMFINIRVAVHAIFKWAIKWGGRIIMYVIKGIGRILMWGLRAIPKLLGAAWRVAAFLIKVLLPGFGHIIVAIANKFGVLMKFLGKAGWSLLKGLGKALLWLIKGLGGLLWKMIKFIGTKVFQGLRWLAKAVGGFIWRGIKGLGGFIFRGAKGAAVGLFNLLKGFVQNTLKNLLTKLGAMLGKLPLIGGALKKLGSIGKGLFGAVKGVGGAVASKLGGKGLLTGIGTMAKMSKAIPILGAVATLGFGAVETYNNFKNHGWKAGLATAGKTIAATTLAATGNTVASMAVDIGGTLAINKFLKKKAGEGAVGGPTISPAGMAATGGATTVVNIQTQNGETLFEQMITTQTNDEGFSFDLSNNLQAADQT